MPHTVVRRGLAAAAMAALALGGLTACGGDDSSAPAPSTTPGGAIAPTTTDATPTPTPTPGSVSPAPTTDTTVPTSPGGSPSPLTGTPVTADQFADILESALRMATTADITLRTTGQAPLAGAGQIDFHATPPNVAATLTSSAFGGKADVRLVDGTFYIQVGSLGPKFLTFRLDDPHNPFGQLISGSLDPSSLADIFRKGLRAGALVGTEKGLRHYVLEVSSSAILAQYPASIRSQAAALLPKLVTYDMYFDGHGLLRRTRFDLGTAGVTDQSYDDWGTKVHIVAPPASQTKQG